MTRSRWSAALLALLIPFMPVTLADARPAATPDRIELPDGWQPEGITTDGDRLYVGSLANGAIWKANPYTGKGRVLAPGRTGRVAYRFPSDAPRFLNDLVVTRIGVFAGGQREVRHDADAGHGVLDHPRAPLAVRGFVAPVKPVADRRRPGHSGAVRSRRFPHHRVIERRREMRIAVVGVPAIHLSLFRSNHELLQDRLLA